MQTEHSYGALLYFIHNETRYYILIGAIRAEGVVEYGFPKGHPEPQDLTIFDTVLREVQEETGISKDQIITRDCNDDKPAFSLSYLISKQGQVKNKTSTYYPLEMHTIDIQSILNVPRAFVHEISDIRIIAEDKVSTLLAHDDEKRLFEKRRREFKIFYS